MTIDVWMQHPTKRFFNHEMLETLLRWTGQDEVEDEIPIGATVAAMDAGGTSFGLLSAWTAPYQPPLVSNEEVAGWVEAHPEAPAAPSISFNADRVQAIMEFGRDYIGFGLYLLRNPD